MLTTVTCWIAVCDTCGQTYGAEADGERHYASPAEARQALAASRLCEHADGLDHLRDPDDPGWQELPSGSLRCDGCEIERLCREHGHDWGPWRRCRGFSIGHAIPNGTCFGQVRGCGRCHRQQHRTHTEGAVS